MLNQVKTGLTYTGQAAKQAIPAALATAAVHFGKQALPTISTAASEYAGRIFSVLPAATPALAGFGIMVAIRVIDKVILEKALKFDPKTITVKKEACSFGATTVITAAVAAATAGALGTAVLPAVITAAVTAAIVWLVVKATDLAIHYAVKGLKAVYYSTSFIKKDFDAKLEKLGLTPTKIDDLATADKKLLTAYVVSDQNGTFLIENLDKATSEKVRDEVLPMIKTLRSNLDSMKKVYVYKYENSEYVEDKQKATLDALEKQVKGLEDKFAKIGSENKEPKAIEEAGLYMAEFTKIQNGPGAVLEEKVNDHDVRDFVLSDNKTDVITKTSKDPLQNNDQVKAARKEVLEKLEALLKAIQDIKVGENVLSKAVYKDEPKFKETVKEIFDGMEEVDTLIKVWKKVAV